MKKLIYVFILFINIFFLIGCDGLVGDTVIYDDFISFDVIL
jgi:hypothetical protein